jgi:integrative and conjugative element protein (TIGR02256 family)
MISATNSGAVFQNEEGHRFKLTKDVLILLKKYRQFQQDSLEAGGILLGRYLRNSDDVVVDRITTPIPADQRSRLRFYRSSDAHQGLIDEAWHDSTGTCNYLGEWHTHAESNPFPSIIDFLDWGKRFLFDRIDSNRLYFVIVGTEHINVWQMCRRWLQIKQLDLYKRVY